MTQQTGQLPLDIPTTSVIIQNMMKTETQMNKFKAFMDANAMMLASTFVGMSLGISFSVIILHYFG